MIERTHQKCRPASGKRTWRQTRALKMSLAALVMIGLGMVPGPQARAEGALAALYAARPPAGSSFVRIVNSCAQPLRVQIDKREEHVLQGAIMATDFVVIKGNTPFAVQAQGKTTQMKGAAPDVFVTLVAQCAADGWRYAVIEDPIGADNGLKAELRFYNLLEACTGAQLRLGENGPTVFAATPAMHSEGRPINPVQAKLAASCGTVVSSIDLPTLKAGDHYSLFLTGAADKPQLSGQINNTAPFDR